jgi:hypothetical protein
MRARHFPRPRIERLPVVLVLLRDVSHQAVVCVRVGQQRQDAGQHCAHVQRGRPSALRERGGVSGRWRESDSSRARRSRLGLQVQDV